MLRGAGVQYVRASVLFQALVRMVVWIQERGWENHHHHPVEDVSTLQGL